MDFRAFIMTGRYGLPIIIQIVVLLAVLGFVLRRRGQKSGWAAIIVVPPIVSVLFSYFVIRHTIDLITRDITYQAPEYASVFQGGNELFLPYLTVQFGLLLIQVILVWVVIRKNVLPQ